MDFEKICMIFAMQEPYYGILLSSMDRRPDNKVQTAGVWQSGNVFKLSYNQDYVNTLNVDQVLTLLKHEILHVAFNHFSMWAGTAVSAADHRLQNIANDLEINCYLNKSIVKSMNLVNVDNFGFKERLGAREYYKLLLKKAEDEQKKQQQQQQQNSASSSLQQSASNQGGSPGNSEQSNNQNKSQQGGQGGQPNGNKFSQSMGGSSSGNAPSLEEIKNEIADSAGKLDDHSRWPSSTDEVNLENIKQQIEDLLEFAAEETEKGRGEIPAELKGRITDIRNRKRPRPVADWKRYFRRYIGNEFSEYTRKSRKRESKRFPDAAGTRHRRKSHILVGIDTSGSVSMPEYREFMGQMRTLMQHTTFHVIECDSRIQHEYEFNGRIPEELHGGGGTDFQPVIDRFLENKRKYEGIVYFTDGCAPIPYNTPKETLWVISSRGRQDRTRYLVNGAKAVFIPKTNK